MCIAHPKIEALALRGTGLPESGYFLVLKLSGNMQKKLTDLESYHEI